MTCRLLNFVDKSLYHGVTYGTIEEIFFRYAVDPLLQATDPLIRDIVLTAFAARVRTGYYGNGNQIKVQGVTEALAAISKTIEMAGQKKTVYRSPKTHNLQIERCIEGWRRQDPPAVPQLALPVIAHMLQRQQSNKPSGRFLHPPTCRRIHKTKNNYPSWAPHACNSHNPIPHQGRRFLQGLKNPPTKITFARSPLSRSSNPQNHKSNKWPNGGDDNSRNSEQSNPRTRGVAMFNTCHWLQCRGRMVGNNSMSMVRI
jgi:hypothetical protein